MDGLCYESRGKLGRVVLFPSDSEFRSPDDIFDNCPSKLIKPKLYMINGCSIRTVKTIHIFLCLTYVFPFTEEKLLNTAYFLVSIFDMRSHTADSSDSIIFYVSDVNFYLFLFLFLLYCI